jgi:transcriptional regulator with XRE-family HTH domain
MALQLTFGRFARNARSAKGLGLREVAREFGISAAYLSRVENDLEPPSGELIADMAKRYEISVEELIGRAVKPRVSAAAHGHAIQSSPELRALYRLGVQFDPDEIEEFIRKFLRDQGQEDGEIEKRLASLKAELPRVANNPGDGLFAADARPRFLSKQRISTMAYDVLERNGLTAESYVPPTRIESLVENEPGIIYRIEELKSDRQGNPLVLGLTGWSENGERQIVVTSLLADSAKESDEHRFNFTLAHELFHAIEHLPRLNPGAVPALARMQVFVDREVSRSYSPAERAVNRWVDNKTRGRGLSTNEDWREWQANLFSAALLMPEWAVFAEFEKRIGPDIVAVNEPRQARQRALEIAGEKVFESGWFAETLAGTFAVSRQAMAIRLLQLGLVREGSG